MNMKELEYEIIPVNELEVAEEIHVRLADGSIHQAENFPLKGEVVFCTNHAEFHFDYDWLEAFGIEPLRVVQRKPLSFEGDYLGYDHDDFGTWILIGLPDDVNILPKINSIDKRKFQVTQILEEDK